MMEKEQLDPIEFCKYRVVFNKVASPATLARQLEVLETKSYVFKASYVFNAGAEPGEEENSLKIELGFESLTDADETLIGLFGGTVVKKNFGLAL